MKILFTGPYADSNSGWSKAGQLFIRALDTTGVTIASRPYKLNDDPPNLHPRVKELEDNSSVGADLVVHCGLPHNFKRSKVAKNIGIVFTESRNYSKSFWPAHMNLMDKIIVPSSYAQLAAITSGVTVPCNYFGVPTDLDKYNEVYPKLEMGDYNNFRFLFVGDATLRKGLPFLIKAFHSEFSPNEPVSLVIKTSKYGVQPEQLREQIIKMIEEVKSGLRIRKNYAKEIIITESLSDKNMMQLHANCDCIVAPSYGDGWNIPVIDSLGFGKLAITTNTGGFKDYETIKVSSHRVPCFGITETFDGLMTSDDNWDQPDILDLRKKMREVYRGDIKTTQAENISALQEFSLENVGSKMLEWMLC